MPTSPGEVITDSGWNCTAAIGRRRVLDRHDDAVVLGLGGDRQHRRQAVAHRVERVVAADGEALRQGAQ